MCFGCCALACSSTRLRGKGELGGTGESENGIRKQAARENIVWGVCMGGGEVGLEALSLGVESGWILQGRVGTAQGGWESMRRIV